MATTVQFRRGNTADNNNFTGKLGEITVDTDKWQLRVHDNVTVGGHTISAGTTSSGTVTSVGLSGGTTGLTVATNGSIYSNITASGTFTLAGTLNVTNGGTGTANPVMTATAPLAITGTWPNVTVALTGTVGTANGGTGVTAAPAANQVLLGTGSGYALTTLVAGNGVTFDQTQNNILTIKSSGGTGSGNTITLADMPPGSIQWFAMQTPPAGWLECNGSILSRTDNSNQYADLWAAIKYTYGGSGDSFKIPDLRGQFLRGWDNGRGVDAGRVFGTKQEATGIRYIIDNLSYGGTWYNPPVPAIGAKNVDGYEGGAGSDTSTTGSDTNYWSGLTQNTGSGDNSRFKVRPTNVAMIACIKYTAGIATQIVTSVNVSGGTTGLLFSGGPITSTGTITASGTLAVANGGTGITVANPTWHYTFGTAGGVHTNDITMIPGTVQILSIKFNNQIAKQNITYDSNTGIFTVTVAGLYHLYSQVQYISVVDSYWLGIAIVKTGGTITEAYNQVNQSHSTVYCSITVPLVVGDTFYVNYHYYVAPTTGGGFIQTSYPARNYFGGYRVG